MATFVAPGATGSKSTAASRPLPDAPTTSASRTIVMSTRPAAGSTCCVNCADDAALPHEAAFLHRAHFEDRRIEGQRHRDRGRARRVAHRNRHRVWPAAHAELRARRRQHELQAVGRRGPHCVAGAPRRRQPLRGPAAAPRLRLAAAELAAVVAGPPGGTAGGGGTMPGGQRALAGAGVGCPDDAALRRRRRRRTLRRGRRRSLAGGAISGGGPLSPRCCCEPM